MNDKDDKEIIPFPLTEEEKAKIAEDQKVPWDPPATTEDLRKDRPTYTTIHHKARATLRLTICEYCVLDSIRVIGHIEPEAKGWCNASKQYLAKFLNFSESAVNKAIKKGVERGYLERKKAPGPKGMIGFTRTTALFNRTVKLSQGDSVKNTGPLGTVKSTVPPCKKYSTPPVKSTEYKNENDKNFNNNVTSLFDFFKISLKDRNHHLAEYSEQYVLEKLQLLYKNSEKVKNPGGWLHDALRNDWKKYKTDHEEDEDSHRHSQVEAAQTAAEFKAAAERPDIPPDAKAALDRLKGKPSITEKTQQEENERRIELHKQRVKLLKDAKADLDQFKGRLPAGSSK